MVNDEDRWRRQDLSNQNSAERFAEIDEQEELFLQELIALWEELRTSSDRLGLAIQEVTRGDQTAPDEHMRKLRRFAEEKHKQLL